MAINKKLIFWKSATFNPPTSSTDTTKDVLWSSIVFFGSTAGTYANSIWTHGQVFSAGTWGTNQTNYVPLTLSGTTYNLSKDGHTHNYLPLTGGILTGTVTAPKILINKVENVASGISWYNSTYTAWQDYMANSGTTGNGVNANITAPSGTLVTAWARRSFIEGNAGFGWTFENGTNSSTTPSVVAEIRASDGAAKFGGTVTAPTFVGALTGNASSATYASAVTLTADNTTNATRYPLFVSAATGNLSPSTDTGFTYNPSTGTLTATTFSGALSGNASSANLLVSTGGLTTQHGDGKVGHSGPIAASTTGIYPTVNNANSILTINRHPGNYYSQLGFSSNGNMYYRSFSGVAIDTTTAWNTVLTESNYNSYALPLTGGTMTGALNFKNGTWNNVGDDVALGDINVAGQLGIKALNSAIAGIAFYNNSGIAIGNLTSNAGTLQWSGSTVWHAGNDGAGTGLDADLLDGYQSTAFLRPFHTNSDFVNGTLVQTNIPSNTTDGASFILEATGKSYSDTHPPFSFIIQGYLYNNTIIKYSGSHITGYGFDQAKILDNGGTLAFWWPSFSYWNSFQVIVRDATYTGTVNNRVTAITDVAEPTSSKKVTVTMIKNLSSANYTEYTIPKTGGTITGNLTATAFYESSDINLKTNIQTLNDNVVNLVFSEDFIKSFDWKSDSTPDYGVIAQHIEKYFPNLITTNTSGSKHVKYNAVLSLIAGAAVKKIKSLEERITNLENK